MAGSPPIPTGHRRVVSGRTASRAIRGRAWRDVMSDDAKVYVGTCFCGAVELTVTGEPIVMGYCHCNDCRSWFATPVNAFSIWRPEAVRVTRGAENVGGYAKTDRSVRKWCKACGGNLHTEHPPWGVTDVPAVLLPDLLFRAALHVNYESTVLPMRDGLPKQRDFPAEMGGS